MSIALFPSEVYSQRREALRARLHGATALFVGAREAAINYRDNPYPFVQDGSFAYFFGLREPDLVGIVGDSAEADGLFGDDPDLVARVWHGDIVPLAGRAQAVGIARTGTLNEVAAVLEKRSRSGEVHFPPPYRGTTVLRIAEFLGIDAAQVRTRASSTLVDAIVAQREIKDAHEIAEMERALEVTDIMHRTAFRESRPGVFEREVVAEIERVVRRLDQQLAYPAIFSKRGEILHNHDHSNRLEAGDLIVNDSGAASVMGYASDITRTIPVGGRFTGRSRDLYEIVRASQAVAIAAVRGGVRFVDVHKIAMGALVDGLKTFGVFRGDAADVVESGAYAVVCQGGLGHQIGLDVHDMESLGEDQVGYDALVQRSPLFGLNRLRLGKALKPGMTITIEPGLYFIAPLIESWAAERRHADQIDYAKLKALIGAGGLRVEDEVLVTETGCRVLGPPIPKSPDEVEAAMAA